MRLADHKKGLNQDGVRDKIPSNDRRTVDALHTEVTEDVKVHSTRYRARGPMGRAWKNVVGKRDDIAVENGSAWMGTTVTRTRMEGNGGDTARNEIVGYQRMTGSSTPEVIRTNVRMSLKG